MCKDQVDHILSEDCPCNPDIYPQAKPYIVHSHGAVFVVEAHGWTERMGGGVDFFVKAIGHDDETLVDMVIASFPHAMAWGESSNITS